MYCYTVANSVNCVVRELRLWSGISSEHPVFLRTVAGLSRKHLSKKIIQDLEKSGQKFRDIYTCAGEYAIKWEKMYCYPAEAQTFIGELVNCLQSFLEEICSFLEILNELKEYGKQDRVWQALVEHVGQEEKYMHRLMETLMRQINIR